MGKHRWGLGNIDKPQTKNSRSQAGVVDATGERVLNRQAISSKISRFRSIFLLIWTLGLLAGMGSIDRGWAQTLPNPNNTIDRNNPPPSQVPLPEPQLPERIPSLPQLLPPANPTIPDSSTPDLPGTIRVKRFQIMGSTVFSQADFDRITQAYLNRDISVAELFEIRSKITELYLNQGYVTSGAIVPPQRIGKEDGIVAIQVIEGRVDAIEVKGNTHLSADYVRARIARYTGKPLNQQQLLSGLQLLRLNPLINNVKAELAAGIQPGSSVLTVEIGEAPIWQSQIGVDNNRSPSAGTDRRQVQVRNSNVFGWGDSASVSYTNTNGSNGIDLNYQTPIDPQNTRLSLSYGSSSSSVIEQPFNTLDIRSKSNYYEASIQHPIIQTPTQELEVGLVLSHRQSQATLLDNIPFPSAGADVNGQTKLSAVRLVQSYTQRNDREVFAARSQFSAGVGALGATINSSAPDSRFFAWRGQAQYVKLLAPDSILLVRGDVQVADRAMLPLEQFGLGGVDSVRGYRQDALLADNGVFASTEARFPIARFAKDSSLQLTPFVDFGAVWNNSSEKLARTTLLSTGLGLRYQVSDRLTAKVEWGIPLISLAGSKSTWQENGIYFSVIYNPF
jgi:hemolysin activation/secretion protein